jgi:tRNA-dihydrouridine synthase B
MAGVADRAFREICRSFGAAYTVTEMVSAQGLVYRDRKTGDLLSVSPDEPPLAAQIFGSDPDVVAQAAPMAIKLSGADVLDLNMGCPTPKIVSGGDGCALMRDLALAERIIRGAVDAAGVPVTVKFRLGWDSAHINCVAFAQMAEAAGAAAVCVHARTREQLYSGSGRLALDRPGGPGG